MRRLYPTLWARLMANCRVTERGCWEWTASSKLGRSEGGRYPTMSLRVEGRHRTLRAGRVLASIVLRRALRTEETIEHLCVNSLCISPNEGHMTLLSNEDNASSMRARVLGREWHGAGREVRLVEEGHAYWHPTEDIPF